MAELPGNFVNPAYATPEQLATQRAYAAELMKRSGQDVTGPGGAIANALLSITGGLERNRANEIQAQAAESNAANMTALIRQLQQGQPLDAANVARMTANPMVSPEQRNLMIEGLIRPKPVEDVAGRPGFMSPAQGVQAATIQGGFQPGVRQGLSTQDASITNVPAPAPMAAPPRPVVAPTSRVWGDKEAQAAGLYPSPGGTGGGQGPGAGLPPAPAPAMPQGSAFVPAGGVPTGALEALAATGRKLAAERERTQGGAKGEAEVIAKDVAGAAAAPATLKDLAIMRDTIQTVGKDMTFGPTAKASNEFKRVVDNYLPGFIDKGGLAGADAIEKLNLSLAGRLSQQLGLNPSDIQRSIGSVPGVEKSKEGTLALIGMLEQSARNDQYVGTKLYQQNRGDLASYQQARQDYLDSHPIVNPITGRPVQIDAKSAPLPASGGVGGYEKTATNPQTGEKLGLRNGRWEPIK